MFLYQAVAFDGSPAKAETSPRGRVISISVTTSTAIQEVCHSTFSRVCRTNVSPLCEFDGRGILSLWWSVMADGLLAVIFVSAAAVSLATSWLLVSRLERIGARIGLTEALLGMLAALAADAPEITASVTALAGHHSRASGLVS